MDQQAMINGYSCTFNLIPLRGMAMLPSVRSGKSGGLAGFTKYPYVYSGFPKSMFVFV
jgi:hypothetical protein